MMMMMMMKVSRPCVRAGRRDESRGGWEGLHRNACMRRVLR
jgi:hypothetical protein